MDKIDIKSLTEEQLRNEMISIGEKAFRGTQIFQWIYKGAKSFSEMKNITAELRGKLEDKFVLRDLKIDKKLVSAIDGTRKYLFRLHDGTAIESVMMIYKHGVSVCISTQAGCRMGCNFCASTIGGLERNLTAGEMLDQIMKIQEDAGKRVSNVVLMGSGEPFDNFEEVIRFLHVANEKNGLCIGYRHITLSTCGIVPKIYEIADMGMPINLAISLHAANDEKRKTIMPIANAYSIDEIIKACRYFVERTNRRITFEYSLIKGFNDSPGDAKELAGLLKGMLAHVNLIPVNSIEERDYKKPSKDEIEAFTRILAKSGISATVRREMGSDINGACGQLRKSSISG
ncbi:ribosomal RNA large subunit methyltransferase N [Peptoclostridium acidaminophilum DSM 3953]|uniref:Probable dual-specificity RNA methyltransferase RlmN n=2 Tax=Peptoclostridium acidaminophilum TaxID=1731 RepID=W8T4S5_PEPAC|nr:23S rRNA (adenine(2503)-C(2))-methyltransferase RlmN [Peptoclostridium acidaminophilum]AHM56764.1 ribosomal RNA large subunit methyltransferase N [Peptoclostridium acidaminophilum DSM 3953]